MYFGVPSVHGKWGVKSDTPVNEDIHWRMRCQQETQLTKKFEHRLKKQNEPHPDAFIKREWTRDEDQQLKAAIQKHGTNNWKVMCQDRQFLGMIANHTEEDIKARWRFLLRQQAQEKKQRRMQRQPVVPSTLKPSPEQTMFGGTRGINAAAIDPTRELRLQRTLDREEDKKRNLERGLKHEQNARFHAEKKLATELRERKKMEQQLQEYRQSLKKLHAEGLVSARSIPSTYRTSNQAAESPVGRSGDSLDELTARSGFTSVSQRTGMTGTTMHSGRSRATNLESEIRSRLTSRSSVVDEARATRRRAERVLETLREES